MVAAGAGKLKVHPNGTYDSEALGATFFYTAPVSTFQALAVWDHFTAEADDRPEPAVCSCRLLCGGKARCAMPALSWARRCT